MEPGVLRRSTGNQDHPAAKQTSGGQATQCTISARLTGRQSRPPGAICGPSSTQSIPVAGLRAKQFTQFPNAWRIVLTTPTGHFGSWATLHSAPAEKRIRTVISDLPEKTEVKAFCQLEPKTGGALSGSVDELASATQATPTA